MTKEHPVAPSYSLLQKWIEDHNSARKNLRTLLIEAAQWGADEELDRCCVLIEPDPCCGTKHQRRILVRKLIERRRPQPKPKKVSMTVSITGTEEELESLFQTLAHDKEVSIQFR